jgi:hypothetical protein
MKGRSVLVAMLVIGLGALVSACSIDVERNPDGSLTATSVMTEESIQQELELALSENDTQVQSVTADLKDGYIDMAMERERAEGGQIDEITFRVELGVKDEGLTATISDVKVNGEPADDERVEKWSERIAQRLEKAGKRRPNRKLQSVSVTETTLTMVWRIETVRSQ